MQNSLPVINSSGTITSVNIESGGIGYGTTTTTVRVDASGKNAGFKPTLQKWRVNQF